MEFPPHGLKLQLRNITNYILTLKVQMEANNAESVDGEIDLEEEKAIHERVIFITIKFFRVIVL